MEIELANIHTLPHRKYVINDTNFFFLIEAVINDTNKSPTYMEIKKNPKYLK